MENKINIAEILKDCPSGMELDCTIWDNVVLDHINMTRDCPIYIRIKGDGYEQLTKYGQWNHSNNAKCVIFPKGKTTWEGFVPPCKFKDGDIVVTQTSYNFIFYSIYQGIENREVLTYVDYYLGSNKLMFNTTFRSLCFTDEIVEQRLATEEEKSKLFQAIKDNGYKWNSETKTLEKLVEPKFKVGDRVKYRSGEIVYRIVQITEDSYVFDNLSSIPISIEHMYNLVPNKFDITTLKPFESRVLVRNHNHHYWRISFFGFFDKNKCVYDTIRGIYSQCIPYEGNEHLCGTTNDCDNFYKTWE